MANMFRAVMKRHFMSPFTFCLQGQSWLSLQQMSTLSSCRGQFGCRWGVSYSVPVGFSQPLCPGLLRGRPSAGCEARLQPLHLSSISAQRRRQAEEPPPRELDLLRYDMRDLWKGPKPALYLGFAGLIPFVAPPMAMAVTELYFPELAYAQVAYGASILSFMGGARWGFALPEGSPAKPDWWNLANSVVPSLLAWIALLLRDNITESAIMVLMGLGVALHYDLALLPTYPSWFKALRAVLTLVATFSLVSTLVLKGTYPEKKLSFWD